MKTAIILWIAGLFGLAVYSDPASGEDIASNLEHLLTVYATKPHDYPTGKDHARPDPTVPFRWHFFRDDVIGRFEAEPSLDLGRYYPTRAGAYGENWCALPGNPWTDAQFQQVRRQAAAHVMALTNPDPQR
jgi:hypothetical protein